MTNYPAPENYSKKSIKKRLLIAYYVCVTFSHNQSYFQKVEEVPMKWIYRPSATEMNRGSAYEMDRQTKCHKNGNATLMDKIIQHVLPVPKILLNFIHFSGIFIFVALCLSIHFRGTTSFHFCGTWSVHPFHRHFLYLVTRVGIIEHL